MDVILTALCLQRILLCLPMLMEEVGLWLTSLKEMAAHAPVSLTCTAHVIPFNVSHQHVMFG